MGTSSASNKPRRLRGTVSFRARNYFAAGVILVGTAAFAGLYAAFHDPIKSAKVMEFFKITEEEKERRALMAFIKRKRAEEIAKIREEIEEFKKFT